MEEERKPLNTVAIKNKWLLPCGSCDAGLPMRCSHPTEDYRPVILELVNEIAYLRLALVLALNQEDQ